jgi:hypothetical protein
MSTIGVPGHWREGADTNHFFGLCAECDAHIVLNMTFDEVEEARYRGHLSQAKFEGYRWVWMTSSFKFGTFPDSWSREPEDEEARAFGVAVRENALAKRAKGA